MNFNKFKSKKSTGDLPDLMLYSHAELRELEAEHKLPELDLFSHAELRKSKKSSLKEFKSFLYEDAITDPEELKKYTDLITRSKELVKKTSRGCCVSTKDKCKGRHLS